MTHPHPPMGPRSPDLPARGAEGERPFGPESPLRTRRGRGTEGFRGRLANWGASGGPMVWLTAGAVSVSLIMVLGLVLLIAVRGLGHFWPAAVVETVYVSQDGSEERILGTVRRSETVTPVVLGETGYNVPEELEREIFTRHLFQVGNRDLTGQDFRWFPGPPFTGEWSYPEDALLLERTEWGNFYGYLRAVKENGEVVAEGDEAWEALKSRVRRAGELRSRIQTIERRDIGNVNLRMERIRLEERGMELRGEDDPEVLTEFRERRAALDEEYSVLEAERAELLREIQRDAVVAETMDGRTVDIPLSRVVRAAQPNNMSVWQKAGHYVGKFWEFVSDYPREANTEGGILPAIFGTVIMVLLMSIFVTPIGVLAAIYLREYAKQGPFVQFIRICVNNLAGVPSIVFGVFGLGFFIYFVGGGIDRLLYPEALPAPTFGTPGLLWASLTLALLTLPVVIVATEEGLTRIPRSIREASYAVGSTKAETVWKIVVPMAAPAMMTGMILAVARAAGEVAPLMLVGVVKLAPNLPLDGIAPFLHLERKFMHLGFHIYDVGFQSPNVEAARPLVYATALTLVLIIVALNLTAIAIRQRLREKYRSDSD
jgi:phosphate transport system permease protein